MDNNAIVRRGTCVRLNNGRTVNAELTGLTEETVRKFDVLARTVGSTRSELFRRFIDYCVEEGRIMIPGFDSVPAKKDEKKADEKKEKVKLAIPRDLFSGIEEIEKNGAASKKNNVNYVKTSLADDFEKTISIVAMR